MITSLLRARSTVVWCVLVVATLISWAVSGEHRTGSGVVVVVLGIAMIKVRFVGLDLMELRNAPIPIRAAFEVNCVALFLILSGMYLWL